MEHSFSWPHILQSLQPAKDEKFSVRCLDTVILIEAKNMSIRRELSWYFTTKNGSIAKKKVSAFIDMSNINSITEDLQLKEFLKGIRERFSRFSLSNPLNTSHLVAISKTLNHQNVMSESDFSLFTATEQLESLLRIVEDSNGYIQVYVRPCKGIDCSYVCNVSLDKELLCQQKPLSVDDIRNSIKHTFVVQIEGSAAAQIIEQSHLINQVTDAAKEIVSFLRDNRDFIVNTAAIRFIVDDNEHAWLSEIGNCSAYSTEDLLQFISTRESASLDQSNINNKTDDQVESQPLKLKKGDSVSESKKKKTKTVNNNGTDSKVGKKKISKLDEPPSIDLLAKFAAERDRQAQILQQSYNNMNSKIDAELQLSARQKDTSSVHSGIPRQKHKKLQNRNPTLLPSMANSGSLYPIDDSDRMDSRKSSGPRGELDKTDPFLLQIQQQSQPNFLGHSRSAGNNIIAPDTRLVPLNSMRPRPLGGTQPSNSATPLISGSEAEFLARQIHSADSSQLSSVSRIIASSTLSPRQPLQYTESHVNNAQEYQPALSPSAASSVTSVTGLSMVDLQNKMGDALVTKIAAYEKQITLLTSIVESKEAELEKKDNKLRRVSSELETIKKNHGTEMQNLLSQHENDIIRLREQFAREKAAITLAVHNKVDSPMKPKAPAGMLSPSRSQQPDTSNHSSSSIAYEANTKLLEQLDILRNEQRKLQDSFAEERRNTQIDHSNKLLTQERKLKSEIMELKGSMALLEDKLAQAYEELQSAAANAQKMQNLNAQLEVSRASAIEAQTRLRADLKNMQQSIQASYRLETSQGIPLSTDPTTAIKLNDAKNEAKTRQLQNKMEFLKSQLEAEQKSSEEAKKGMESMRQKLEEIRDEFRIRMLEAEQSRKNSIEDTEQRLESYYEDRMRELSTLQSRVKAVQGQLEEATSDSTLAKQREEASKAAMHKSLAHQSALRAEIEQLKAQVQQMTEERDQENARNSSKPNSEAVIRRLDNERQYLKSQLASEITHKNEMQTALINAQQQLSDVQQQWSSDVDSLKESLSMEGLKLQDCENRLKQTELHLQGELSRISAQNKDLKDGFVKMRDQVRMEQLALENALTNNRRLSESLESSRSEVQRLQQLDADNALMHKQQMEAVHSTMKEQEAIQDLEMKRMKDELTRQILLNSDAQSLTLDLKERFETEKNMMLRSSRTAQLFQILNKFKSSRMHVYFRVWSTNNTLMSVAQQFRGQVEELLQKNTDDMNQEKQVALSALRDLLGVEHKAHEAFLRNEFEAHLNNKLMEWEEKKNEELKSAKEEFDNLLSQAESDFQFDLQNARNEGEENVLQMEIRKNKEMDNLREHHRADAVINEQNFRKELNNALQNKEEEMNVLCNQKMEKQAIELGEKHDKAMLQAAVDFDFKCHSLKTDFDKNAANLKKKHDETMVETMRAAEDFRIKSLADLTRIKDEEILNIRSQLHNEQLKMLSDQKAQMEESHEERIRKLRVVWKQELDENIAAMRKEFDDMLKVKMEEFAKKMDLEKQQAVKLEGSKWKQAMKESDANHELDMMKAKAELSNEKDKETKVELEKLSNRFELLRSKESSAFKQQLEDLRLEHQTMADKQANLHEIALEKAKKETEMQVKEQMDAAWNEKLQNQISAVENNLNGKLAKEKERLEQLKQEFAQMSSNFAAERSALQRQVNNSDERIRKMEEMNKLEIEQVRKDGEALSEIQREVFEDQKRGMLQKFSADQKLLTDTLNEQHKQSTDQQIAAEKKMLRQEFDFQMSLVQEESEKLVTGLETAMTALAKEKTALTSELESLSSKLEETEDLLFDAQQDVKKREKEQSMAVWKSVVKVLQMKERFQKGIQEFDREAEKRYESIRKEMQGLLNESSLTVLKLCSILQDVEARRKATQAVLTSYKSEELNKRRSKIQQLEKDLDRLTLEKEALEEQRDSMEADLQQFEHQVRDLEDQIREHNRESSMTNGRVNVAHARKKRRLDSELERILETIDQKRAGMAQMDARAADKIRQRDDKELEMVELERELVQILLEQQRLVLSKLDEAKTLDDRSKLLVTMAGLPWPPPLDPTMQDIIAMNKKKQEEDDRA